MIYQDTLISITEDSVVFEHYYFPSGKGKSVRWGDIEGIDVMPTTIRNGRWRIHGTGDFKTWFPKDRGRPEREKVFFAKLKSQRMDIGFTVEDADEVERIFREKGLIKAE